ncbi:unnamed protein product [Effrenium voratum]|uniref:C3H1-type domain-containing protein n=1 Tax=Effrenium voratum TaxID=2562239 RepID=A0AA36NCC7_9DINO|nr:unnamed protein product [Effrenium voratum]
MKGPSRTGRQGVGDIQYPVPLFVHNTFIEAETGRPASLEGFFHERQVFSCPGSRIDEDDTSAPRRMPYQPGEQLMRSAALDPLKDEVEPSPGAQASVPREEERSECSTADTGSFARNLCAAAPELPVLRLEAALSSVPLEKLENYSMGAAGHEVRQCRPCAFFHTKGCSSGRDCEFCHLCPKGEKQRRQKEKRAFFGAMRSLQKIAAESWPFRSSEPSAASSQIAEAEAPAPPAPSAGDGLGP